jgi:hypothetical protein
MACRGAGWFGIDVAIARVIVLTVATVLVAGLYLGGVYLSALALGVSSRPRANVAMAGDLRGLPPGRPFGRCPLKCHNRASLL